MFGRRKCSAMNSALIFLGVCSILLPTNWVVEGLSDFRLCADPQCQSIISQGTGKITYRAGQEGMVSFKINSKIRIKSKSAGKDPSLWGIDVNGREGYAPKEYILEERVIVKDKDLLYTVPVILTGSQTISSTTPPTPAAVLKPSENIPIKKEDVEITTTAPLLPQLEIENSIPLTSRDRESTKEDIRQATPVQSDIEIIDGTEIPVLEKVTEKENYFLQTSLNSDNPEISEKQPFENSSETTEVKEQVNKPEPIINNTVQEQNTSIIEETKDIERGLPTLGIADDDDNVEDEEDEGEDYSEEEEDDPIMGKNDEEKLNSLDKESDFLNVKNFNETDAENKPEDSSEKEKSNLHISDRNETHKIEEKPSIESSADNITVINETIDTETATEKSVTESVTLPQKQLLIPQVDLAEEFSESATSNETGKEVPSELSERLPVPNTLAETIPLETELQPNVSIEDTTQSTPVTTAEEKVDDNASSAEHNVPTLQIFKTPTQYQPQLKYKQEQLEHKHVHTHSEDQQHTHQHHPQDQNHHLDPSTQQNNIPEASEEITTKAVDVDASQRSGDEELHTPYYPKPIDEQIFNQPPLGAYSYETVTESSTSEVKSEQLDTVTPTFSDVEQSNEVNDASDEDIVSIKRDKIFEEETTSTPAEENSKNGDVNVGAVEENLSHTTPVPLGVDTVEKPVPHSTPIPVEEYETTTSAPRPSIEEDRIEYETKAKTSVPLQPVEEYERTTTTSVPLPPVEEHSLPEQETKEKEQGLFATILGTVNNFLSNGKKDDVSAEDEELQRILYPDRAKTNKKSKESDAEYCEKLSPNDCPSQVLRELNNAATSSSSIAGCQLDLNNMSMDMLLTVAGNKMFEMSELLACLATVAVTCLFFLFVYYCFCNSSREGELLARLNALERSLLATHKENAILKEDLMGTRNKLSSIEDNSFGSNDMVIALKQELEDELLEKRQLQDQVGSLEKELENAAEAGLELNKIVSELLNNQTGDESIISSVEELQKQLNEQQKTILDINANLAEKSRENSELQLMIAEQNARLSGEIASLQQDNDELEVEKSNLQTRLEETKREFEEDITKALEGKNFEIKRLQSELVEMSTKLEAEHTKYQTSLAKVEALEECLRTVRRDPSVNINNVIDVANVRAELLDVQKRYAALKDRLDTETDAKKLFEQQLQLSNNENEKLKHDFHQSEKDKLEAQTRLEVLSNYFKEKETQLQKELSLKEAMWLKQQGETTSTVDRVTTMQQEIQALKSQNDALRAEIEAQLAAHKAQTGTLENRAHETWLAARQSERRYEEARAEATALRRKLTSLAGGATGEANFEKMAAGELNNANSPIHMESPGSPLLGRLPPPPFLPPPFMGPPPPFMGMPPPFVPPGEMRPPPLGRLMSPPPGAVSGGSGHLPPPRSSRYSPNRTDYDAYDDDEDEDDYVDDEEDEDEEEQRMRQHHRRRGSDINGSWHRDDSYSPPPRAYRSQSPTDSRYNYNTERDLISTYDTETDFEPSPSPRKHERRGARGSRAGSYRGYSPLPSASSPLNVSSNSNAGRKQTTSAFSKEFTSINISRIEKAIRGHMSSGSEKSYNAPPPPRHGGKKNSKSAV
nr:transport and Golgi organization protein 1 isoform X1 [Bactrocera oleae]XP_036229835.1 transport and Golgi organization protein 1 isoform X1 [Bactrocera oleae]